MHRTLIAALGVSALIASGTALAQDTGGVAGHGAHGHYARKHNPFCARHPHRHVCRRLHDIATGHSSGKRQH